MTIFFSGNNYKYEIEAVMKLFIPACSFEFIFEDTGAAAQVYADKAADLAYIRIKRTKRLAIASVFVRLDGRSLSGQRKLLSGAPHSEEEHAACDLLYGLMEKLTGTAPKWGLLTGVRPVKRINRLIDEGWSRESIFEKIGTTFHTSEEKLSLAYQTALIQREALLSLPEDSFSLYISIPFCPTRCSYCSFVSHSIGTAGAVKLMNDYVERLCEEIVITGEITERMGLMPDTVYIGGGTPTSLSAEQLAKIMQTVEKSFNLSKIREYTVEAGRSDTITEEKLIAIREGCKNVPVRISINPQTMSNSVLEAIGRHHTVEQVLEAYDLARRLGLENINMDTIAGLSEDTLDGFIHTIDTLTELNPESITVHALTLKRSAAMFREDHSAALSQPVGEMVDYAQRKLMQAGYLPYYLYRQKNTIDNLENVGYAKKGFESLYNIYIMEEVQQVLAVGAGASTKLIDRRTGKITRCFNYKFPYEYVGRFDRLIAKRREFFLTSGNIQ